MVLSVRGGAADADDVAEGDDVRLDCKAEAWPPVQYVEWFYNVRE